MAGRAELGVVVLGGRVLTHGYAGHPELGVSGQRLPARKKDGRQALTLGMTRVNMQRVRNVYEAKGTTDMRQ